MSARTTRTGQGSNSAQVRLYNERIVLQALRRFGEASKTDLARAAGLTNNAIGAITAYLAAAGLVVELGKKREGQRGQPATMLALAPEGAYSIGVRIDRVGCETICVDFGGRILASRAHDTLLPPPKDMLATVFNRFSTNGKTGKRSGAGLGLSIVESFVNLHNGTVSIDSEPGRGTTVSCRIPSAAQPQAIAAAE